MATKQHQSNIIGARRMHVNPLVRQNVDLSFQIVDRIHEILVAKGLSRDSRGKGAQTERSGFIIRQEGGRNQQVDAWYSQFHD